MTEQLTHGEGIDREARGRLQAIFFPTPSPASRTAAALLGLYLLALCMVPLHPGEFVDLMTVGFSALSGFYLLEAARNPERRILRVVLLILLAVLWLPAAVGYLRDATSPFDDMVNLVLANGMTALVLAVVGPGLLRRLYAVLQAAVVPLGFLLAGSIKHGVRSPVWDTGIF